MLGPNRWASPDVGPMTSIPGSAMSFLQADNVGLLGAELVEEHATLGSIAKPTAVDGDDD